MIRMTCREFDEVVHEFVRMELLDEALHGAILDHVAQCSNCAERMSEAGVLAESTEAAAESVRGQRAPQNLEVALLAAFRNRHRRQVWWHTFEWMGAVAAAAVLVIVLWPSAYRSKGQPSPGPRKDISSQSKAPLDAFRPESSHPVGVVEGAEAQVANEAPSETYAMADFVPVPFTDAIGPEDLGMVVRIQLTRSSLAELGYPVAEMPDEDLIRADVLVGEDGWPHGIKLVQ
jgi:hypothetical protein